MQFFINNYFWQRQNNLNLDFKSLNNELQSKVGEYRYIENRVYQSFNGEINLKLNSAIKRFRYQDKELQNQLKTKEKLPSVFKLDLKSDIDILGQYLKMYEKIK